MFSPLPKLRRKLFGVDPEEISQPLRGVPFASEEARETLEGVVRSFLTGYGIGVENWDIEVVTARLDDLGSANRGFAYEGAAMAVQLIDGFVPARRRRLARLLAGSGAAHTYMIHVGVGWAVARRKSSLEKSLARLDPLLGWLAADGYGFHQGFFHSARFHRAHEQPNSSASILKAFDQGIGRSLWFMDGADPERIATSVQAFPPERQSDVLSGVGLACAYAGGAADGAARELVDAFPERATHFAQGVAFAASARQRAGNPAANTEAVSQAIWGASAEALLELAEGARRSVTSTGVCAESYEHWRAAVRALFEAKGVTRVRPA